MCQLFRNVRASRVTELANEYFLQFDTTWLDNTEQLASKHYLQVTDAHFEQAQRAKSGAITSHKVPKPGETNNRRKYRGIRMKRSKAAQYAAHLIHNPNWSTRIYGRSSMLGRRCPNPPRLKSWRWSAQQMLRTDKRLRVGPKVSEGWLVAVN